MYKWFALIFAFVLLSCGLYCHHSNQINVYKVDDFMKMDGIYYAGFTEWRCNKDTVIKVFDGIGPDFINQVMIHEFIHALTEQSEHINNKECYFSTSYPLLSYPLCPEEIDLLNNVYMTYHVKVFDEELLNATIYSIEFINFYMNREALILDD